MASWLASISSSESPCRAARSCKAFFPLNFATSTFDIRIPFAQKQACYPERSAVRVGLAPPAQTEKTRCCFAQRILRLRSGGHLCARGLPSGTKGGHLCAQGLPSGTKGGHLCA